MAQAPWWQVRPAVSELVLLSRPFMGHKPCRQERSTCRGFVRAPILGYRACHVLRTHGRCGWFSWHSHDLSLTNSGEGGANTVRHPSLLSGPSRRVWWLDSGWPESPLIVAFHQSVTIRAGHREVEERGDPHLGSAADCVSRRRMQSTTSPCAKNSTSVQMKPPRNAETGDGGARCKPCETAAEPRQRVPTSQRRSRPSYWWMKTRPARQPAPDRPPPTP
jgi:hypothetical protein